MDKDRLNHLLVVANKMVDMGKNLSLEEKDFRTIINRGVKIKKALIRKNKLR